MPETSRLTFGYYTSGRGYGNILGPEIADLRNFLLQVGKSSQVEIFAWFSTQGGSIAWQNNAVRIKLEGKLSSIEEGLNRIVEQEGVPSFVDRPTLPMALHYLPRILTRNVRDVQGTLTTSNAYEIVNGLYVLRNVKTTVASDNTLVTT